ncbi:MAG: Mov34/MPN/PAD-1 family protein [Acidimicrobiia bacterium]
MPAAELRLPAEIREAIVSHALWCLPAEACGLVAVDSSHRLRMAYPLTNVDASPTRFTIEAREHFGAVSHAESRGWDIGGVFHSHPSGSAVLSPTDVDQPHDPNWFHIVIGQMLDVRAWRIVDGAAVEVTLLTPG